MQALNLGLGRARGRLRFTGGLDTVNYVLADVVPFTLDMTHMATRLTRDRLALLPAALHADPAACHTALVEGGSAFLEFVLAQALGALWHHRLHSAGRLESLPSATVEALCRTRMVAAVGYLAQREALDELDRLFEAVGVPWVAIKGGHVRECVYPDPALRLACDIDILIGPADRRPAAQVLIDAGYRVQAEPANISHEATFSRGVVNIDLHWHMLRPGRTRVDLTAGLLARRQRIKGQWGLSDSDTLFLMLTHPAFAKYVCSPNMGLGRVADFLLWIPQRPVDWPAVLRLLERSGLKTAAWTMLNWFRRLAAPDVQTTIDAWMDTLQPSRLRAVYLGEWLERDLPSRWLDRPFLIQFGFTLALHDRPGDVLHALAGLQRARRHRGRDMALLLGEE